MIVIAGAIFFVALVKCISPNPHQKASMKSPLMMPT